MNMKISCCCAVLTGYLFGRTDVTIASSGGTYSRSNKVEVEQSPRHSVRFVARVAVEILKCASDDASHRCLQPQTIEAYPALNARAATALMSVRRPCSTEVKVTANPRTEPVCHVSD
jgi:hypothetical protein